MNSINIKTDLILLEKQFDSGLKPMSYALVNTINNSARKFENKEDEIKCLKMIKLFIKYGCEIESSMAKYALIHGYIDIFIFCLENGAYYDNIIDNTVFYNYTDMFMLCLEYGMTPSEYNKEFPSLYGNVELFDKYIELGFNPDITDINNAATIGSIKIFNKCIEFGIKPSKKTIHCAARHGNSEIFRLCLKYNVLENDTMDTTIYNNNYDIFKLCLSVGFIPTLDTMNEAALCNNINIFNICLEYVQPNQQTLNNSVKSMRIFKKCIALGIKPNIDTLLAAVNADNKQVIGICIEYDIELTQNIINIAAIKGNKELFNYCELHGLKPDHITVMKVIRDHWGTQLVKKYIK